MSRSATRSNVGATTRTQRLASHSHRHCLDAIEISLVPTPVDPGATVRTGGTIPDATTHTDGAADLPPAGNTEAAQNPAQVNAEIRSIARVAGLGQEFVDGLIDRGASADGARRSAFDELARRGGGALRTEQTRVEVIESHDEPQLRTRQLGEALYARINPQHQLSEPARRYAYATCAEMARELLVLRGHPVACPMPRSSPARCTPKATSA
jgi:hypothetical protein